MNRRGVIYARVSTVDRGDPKSIPDQLEASQALADDLGVDLIGTYVDRGRSGWDPNVRRADYERLLEVLATEDIDVVICQDVDRLFRQDVERVRFDEITKPRRMDTVLFTDGSQIDLSTAKGREAFRDAASKAEGYSDRLSEKIQNKHRINARRGIPNGGPRPFGYTRSTVVETIEGEPEPVLRRTLEVEPKEAEAIRDACARIIAGESLRSVAKHINGDGFRTGWGNEWAPSKLKTVLLSGRIIGKRDRSEKDPRTGERSRLDPAEASWSPIISAMTQDQVARELQGRGTGCTNTHSGKHLLSGLLVCGSCGDGLVSSPQRGVSTYFCTSDDRPHPPGGRVRILAATAEAFIIEQALGVTPPRVTVVDPVTVTADLRAAEKGVRDRMADLARMLAKGSMVAAQFEIINRPLVKQLATIAADIDASAAPTIEPGPWGKFYRETMALPGADDAELRAYLDTVIERAVLRPAGRSKWVATADRIDIKWRPGVLPGA